MKRFVLAVVLLLSAGWLWAAVNVNTASEAQLEQLPGIGPGRAQAIVADRQANGPFRSMEDLGRVKGIGAKTLAGLQGDISFALPAPTAAGSAPAPTDSKPAGFPWLPVTVVALLAALGVTWLLLRRRGPSATAVPPAAIDRVPDASASSRATGAQPAPAPSTDVPHPAAAPGASSTNVPTGMPPRPAGAAGRAAGQAQPPATPAPAGAPPRPAGSRPPQKP